MLEDSANAPSDVPSGFTPPHAAAPEFDAGASTTESSTFAQLGPDVVITPSRPRVWTSIVVGLGAPVFAIIAGSVVVIIAMAMSMGFAEMQQRDKVVQWVSEIASNPLGLAALIIPSQLMFLCGAVGTAALSRERIASRLAIRRGIMPLWTYPLLMLATLAVGMIGGMASLLLPEADRQQLELIYSGMANATGLSAVVIVVAIAIIPGIVEETLFRGYVQSRLLQRWPAALAIGFSAVMFAIAHLDVLHSVSVLPMGIWLGIVAWRANSIVPAILCHAFNNAIGIVIVQSAMNGPQSEQALPPFWVMAIAPLVLVVGVIMVIKHGGKRAGKSLGTRGVIVR